MNLTRALGEQREESAHQTEARTFRGRTFVRPKKEEVSAGSRRRGIHLPYIYIYFGGFGSHSYEPQIICDEYVTDFSTATGPGDTPVVYFFFYEAGRFRHQIGSTSDVAWDQLGSFASQRAMSSVQWALEEVQKQQQESLSSASPEIEPRSRCARTGTGARRLIWKGAGRGWKMLQLRCLSGLGANLGTRSAGGRTLPHVGFGGRFSPNCNSSINCQPCDNPHVWIS